MLNSSYDWLVAEAEQSIRNVTLALSPFTSFKKSLNNLNILSLGKNNI